MTDAPQGPRAATAPELKAQIEAEREGLPVHRLPRRRGSPADPADRRGDERALGRAPRVGRHPHRVGRGGLGPARADRGGPRRVHACRRRPLAQRLLRQRGARPRPPPPARPGHDPLRADRRPLPGAGGGERREHRDRRPRSRRRRPFRRGSGAVLLALCRPFKDGGSVRHSGDQPADQPRSCTSASTPSRPTCGRCSRSSGSRRCRRTRSGSGWSSGPCRAG